MAIRACYQALTIQPSNKSALINLAGTLELLGRTEESDYYMQRVTYYRDHNPYYHYLLGQTAYKDVRYTDALSYLDDAIKLKKDEHQFHYLKGLTYLKLESPDLALRSFKDAKNAAEKTQLIAAYERKLEALETP